MGLFFNFLHIIYIIGVENMWLIVGLGNPGSQYSQTRHNIGFIAIDYFLKSAGNPPEQNQFKAVISKFKIKDHQVVLVKPQTFMNLSGESVQALAGYYKIPPDHIIVIQDDIDQEFGKMKLHQNRGHGGHNGIRSITQLLGDNNYLRLKLGVGRPDNPNIPVADYVLGKFSSDEFNKLPDFLNKAIEAVESIMNDGYLKAATKFNT